MNVSQSNTVSFYILQFSAKYILEAVLTLVNLLPLSHPAFEWDLSMLWFHVTTIGDGPVMSVMSCLSRPCLFGVSALCVLSEAWQEGRCWIHTSRQHCLTVTCVYMECRPQGCVWWGGGGGGGQSHSLTPLYPPPPPLAGMWRESAMGEGAGGGGGVVPALITQHCQRNNSPWYKPRASKTASNALAHWATEAPSTSQSPCGQIVIFNLRHPFCPLGPL